MSEKFEILLKYFPSGEASGERQIIEQVFVKDEDFADFLTPHPGGPRLVIGTKGSGKSSFLDYAAIVLEGAGVPVVKLVPADLVVSSTGQFTIADVTRAFLNSLAIAIASKLGDSLPRYKPIIASDEIIKDLAELHGGRSPDPVSVLAGLASSIEYHGIKFSINSLTSPKNVPISKQLDSIRKNIERSGGAFYVMLDDIDQISALGGGIDVERIYSLLVGIKRLASEIPTMRIVVTLRNEVWRALNRAKGEKLDQLDHFDTAIRTISPSKDQIKVIVRRRLLTAVEELGLTKGYNEYEHFFEGVVARMPGSSETSSWDDLIASRSRERPRDAIQLVSKLAHRHLHSNGRIDSDDLAAVMPEFSRVRVVLTAQEFSSICPNLKELIESLRMLPFSAGAFTAFAEDVKDFLSKVGGRFSIKIDGVALTSTIDSAFTAWRLLYDVGVLNARISDARMSEKYRHLYPNQEPDFVSLANWSEMQKAVWEINPVYRDRLIFLRAEDRARDGLATKPKKFDRKRGPR